MRAQSAQCNLKTSTIVTIWHECALTQLKRWVGLPILNGLPSRICFVITRRARLKCYSPLVRNCHCGRSFENYCTLPRAPRIKCRVWRREREWPIYLPGVAPTSGELPSLFCADGPTDGRRHKKARDLLPSERANAAPSSRWSAGARKIFAWCQAFAISLLRRAMRKDVTLRPPALLLDLNYSCADIPQRNLDKNVIRGTYWLDLERNC